MKFKMTGIWLFWVVGFSDGGVSCDSTGFLLQLTIAQWQTANTTLPLITNPSNWGAYRRLSSLCQVRQLLWQREAFKGFLLLSWCHTMKRFFFFSESSFQVACAFSDNKTFLCFFMDSFRALMRKNRISHFECFWEVGNGVHRTPGLAGRTDSNGPLLANFEHPWALWWLP